MSNSIASWCSDPMCIRNFPFRDSAFRSRCTVCERLESVARWEERLNADPAGFYRSARAGSWDTKPPWWLRKQHVARLLRARLGAKALAWIGNSLAGAVP